RLYGDASAQIHSTGLLGSKVIAVSPGTPAAGPLADGRLRAAEAPDFAKAAAQLGDAAGKITKTADKIGATADETKELVRDVRAGQAARREAMSYNTADLFEPGTAILTDTGRTHLAAVVGWLSGVRNDKADVVVAALCDPNDRAQTSASAYELTKKQGEAVVEF